jgi:Domain of unknown function (DUF4062)/MTH538 TIR-like domain (DUF1863)
VHFDGDAFISYAHLDNQELVEGRKGWVANLHRALEIRVGQLLGKAPHIWRDPKLQGNDFFAETLVDRLKRVAVLVAVVSPRYTRSEWTRKELETFWLAAETQGGVRMAEKSRIFKVLKTPVPADSQQFELQGLLGYEFFRIDADTGKVRELDEVFGAEAQRDFWLKLDDLAHEICALLERIEVAEGGQVVARAAGRTVFLAETTSDLREERDTIRRDLQQQGYTVLPSAPLPHVAQDFHAAVRADLSKCCLSLHLLGRSYGLVPEGANESLVEIQNELAIERASEGGFARLLWIPAGLEVQDARQAQVLNRIRSDQRMEAGADLLETFLEDFRTLVQHRLEGPRAAAPAPAPEAPAQTSAAAAATVPTVYLVYDQRDSEAAVAWGDALFDRHVEVLHPIFEGDEAEVREYHDESLRTCHGVVLLAGSAGEVWLRRKMRELQKSAGYGRTGPPPALAICLLEPRTPEKERFRTHEGLVIRAWDEAADPLAPFIATLGGGREGRRG